jgi:endoglucanase
VSSLQVLQGNAATAGISLSRQPSANVTVSVARTSGNSGLTAAPASLTFTPANYATAQTVTVTADASSTGAATFTASATGYTAATFTVTEVTQTTSAAPQLHVSGNKLVNASGTQVVLHGVNRSGTEYACVQGNGIFDGPNDQASITAMKSWGPVNAVRVPLNEACWNAESYVNSAYAGTNYINAIKSYVSLLNTNGIVAILDLHWTDGTYTGSSAGCSSAQAVCQKPMPDAAQAIPFWTSVANTFKGNDAVIFDLFNEPYASRATGNTTTGWQCWENGGTCSGISYQVAGMQQMVNAVRSTGANNVLMLGGEEYSNDLTSWLQYKPTDPDNNLVASWHSYNFNTCSSQSCWTSQIAPVIASVPVVAGEIGENDCAGTYINPLTAWLESQNTSFLAWTWDNWSGGCSSGPTLITDYTGTPTNYGAAYKAILQALPAG